MLISAFAIDAYHDSCIVFYNKKANFYWHSLTLSDKLNDSCFPSLPFTYAYALTKVIYFAKTWLRFIELRTSFLVILCARLFSLQLNKYTTVYIGILRRFQVLRRYIKTLFHHSDKFLFYCFRDGNLKF